MKGIILEIYTPTYNHFCFKSKLNRVYIVSFFMCMYTNLAGDIAFFPLNNADTSRNGTASSAVEKRKEPHNGMLPFYNPSFNFPSILLFCLQLSYNWQHFKPLLYLWVFKTIYTWRTSKKKKKMQICHFSTKSSKTWLRNTEVVHSKQLARIAKMIFVNFLC